MSIKMKVLKIAFSIFVVYHVFFSAYYIIKAEQLYYVNLVWDTLYLTYGAFAYGIFLERKWAWNFSVGLTLILFIAKSLITINLLLLSDKPEYGSALSEVIWVNLEPAAELLILFILLIIGRQGYQTRFKVASQHSEPPLKANSYVKPVASGLLLLLVGFCAIAIPTGDLTNPAPIGFFLAFIIWIGAAMCFFERQWKSVCVLAILGTVMPIIGLVSTSFLLRALFMGGIQFVLGASSIIIIAKSKENFIS